MGGGGFPFLAHSVEGAPPETWEPLDHHLRAVAGRAAMFAGAFGAAELGYAAGLLHDAGKLRKAFQRYIRGRGPRAEHAICGALWARQAYPGAIGHILAYVAAGHHAGLPDGGGREGGLEARLQQGAGTLDDMAPWPEGLRLPQIGRLPLRGGRQRLPFACGFLTRMLFSALVDADFLETERFYSPNVAATRAAIAARSLSELEVRLRRHLGDLAAAVMTATATEAGTAITARRADVLAACLRAADSPPGVFSLSVPTGGGKTLSSLAFALRHAQRHGLRRVIYVIPYTSIIEQTADTFRHALGPDLADAVIEHHSAAPLVAEDENTMGPKRLRSAAENWDAPIVVTTTVQFFESLYANRGSRCRKLHNIAASVVVLDEAQALPLQVLAPCVAALRELADNYRSSIVLCSATVPDLRHSPNLGAGFTSEVREIVDDVPALFAAFKRVWTEKAGALDDTELAARLAEDSQVLCIVDARAHAAELYALVRTERPNGVLHLSAAMCPAHRRTMLAEAKERLAAGRPCRLIATQVVEAGVDIDFPTVYRAAAGIDSLAQAAGRCNRHGRRPQGRFVVFDSTRDLFLVDLKRRRELARPMVEAAEDPLSLATIDRYFQTLLNVEKGKLGTDILARFEESAAHCIWPFRSIAEDLRLIGEDTVPVIVPWGEVGPALIDELEACAAQGRPVPLGTLRALQQVTVAVYRGQFARLDQAGAIGRIGPDGGFMALVRSEFYDQATGLTLGDLPRHPVDNIV